ncbi:MAG: endolytic transglycosylase MltG [Candidatus Jacksonbacteria bacterium]
MSYKQILTPLNILIVFFIIATGFVITMFWFLYQDVNIMKNQTYDILPGATSREIAYDLAQKEIIKHPWTFNWYVKLKNLDRELQAGRYEFPNENKMSLKELIEFLASNARAREINFTVPEGYAIEQIIVLLADKMGLKKESVASAIEQFQISNFKFLISNQIPNPKSQSANNLEGYLFPDTYRVYEDAGAEEIIKKMLENFEKKVSDDLIAEVKNQGHSLQEVIIMASILEKEVKTEEDMRKAADILWRRLEVDMALEVDSTLNYILADDDRRASLTFDQLKIDSPYNTYKYKGLPPSPICNPGLMAIRAAIFPEPNDYWFYLSKPDGQTIFSKTYEEHLRNKAVWLK